MKRAILTRLESTDQGTFGRLTVEGVTFLSGELPWRGNASNISCIPSGIYRVIWNKSFHFKRNMFLVEEVSGRAGIRIHSANLMGDKALGFTRQLNGCIALGERLGTIGKQKALLLSAPAVRKFETLMNHKPFILEIKDAYIS